MRRLCAAQLLIALIAGCASARPTTVRLLDSQLPSAPALEAVPDTAATASDHAALAVDSAPTAPALGPRIGAPGGSGAGSRRVPPVQSGNDTVGGLPAGIGGGNGPRG